MIGVVGDEEVRRVVLPEQVGEGFEHARRAVAPGPCADDALAHRPHVQRRGSIGRSGREPRLVARQPDRAIAESVAQRAERLPEVDRSAQRQAALDHRRMERRIGVGPAWAASRSARVRMPW